ncbi:hypothetical protein BC936DRAFT_146954 [Jimgerdemannia flammicorona]|uniref:Uncharacterized protein n=1 Tax=Jimgerdemannia flammicorona TaxID=994334 RepID=A0A433D6F1_9FUNG|nr:hypothetical protein BC936DRAFT_146954 [Jimgerdemannia flammicorona]
MGACYSQENYTTVPPPAYSSPPGEPEQRRNNRSSIDIEELPYHIDDNRYKAVIAIDFGTTFSCCSWGKIETTDMVVKDVEKWPNQVGNYPKIPTAVVYDSHGNLHAWGQTAENLVKFGRMPIGYLYYSKFKLYLDEKVMRSSLPPLPPGKTSVHLIADYLREMHKYVLTKIPNSISRDQIRYCLTIPASWSPDAKRAMREAAILGELVGPLDNTERLLLITEPEAIMIYLKEKQLGIEGCRNVMICDVRGHTVDMSTFAIGRTPNGQQTLHVISLKHSESCGSTFIDMAMENYLRNVKLGPSLCARLHARSVPVMMNSFVDTVKRNFKSETDEYRIPSPVHNDRALLDMLPPTTLIDGIDLILTFEELQQYVFDPVIRDILHLIRDQIRQLPAPVNRHQSSYVCDKLVLVGEFGESEYLLSRVQEEFMRINLICDVETVIHAGLAVVKGILLCSTEVVFVCVSSTHPNVYYS